MVSQVGTIIMTVKCRTPSGSIHQADLDWPWVDPGIDPEPGVMSEWSLDSGNVEFFGSGGEVKISSRGKDQQQSGFPWGGTKAVFIK